MASPLALIDQAEDGDLLSIFEGLMAASNALMHAVNYPRTTDAGSAVLDEVDALIHERLRAVVAAMKARPMPDWRSQRARALIEWTFFAGSTDEIRDVPRLAAESIERWEAM